MKICKDCKTHLDDLFTYCPECGCESFETEEQPKTEDAAKDVSEVAVEEPTIVMDAVKAEPEEEGDAAEETEENEKTDAVEDAEQPADDADTSEEKAEKKSVLAKLAVFKKLKPWQIGIIIGVVVVVIAVVVLLLSGVLSGGNRHYNNAKVETPADIVVEETKPVIKNTTYTMTEEPFDFQVKIGQSVYQLPMMMSEVLSSGWSFGDTTVTEEPVAAGAKVETYLVSSNGAIVFVTITNFSKEAADIKDCCLISLTVDADCLSGEKATLVKNLTMGSLRKAVEDVFGECDDAVQENKGTTLTYTKSDKKYAAFVFDNKTLKLKSVTYFNNAVPEAYEEAEKQEEEEADKKDEYVKPDALGNDITSGTMQIEGDLYKLPILVSELIDNGWEITFKEDRAILYGNEHLFGTLKKGDIEISGVDVYNFDKTDCLIKNCYVISMEASADTDYTVVLPKNIKVGMSEADYLAAINGLEYDFDSTHFNEYVFKKDKFSVTIDVDKDDKTIKYLFASYEVEE